MIFCHFIMEDLSLPLLTIRSYTLGWFTNIRFIPITVCTFLNFKIEYTRKDSTMNPYTNHFVLTKSY